MNGEVHEGAQLPLLSVVVAGGLAFFPFNDGGGGGDLTIIFPAMLVVGSA